MEKRDAGFTLIELLVVMIIIGILAAIAIPLFLNQRKKAEDSAAKADVSTLGKEVATYYVDNTGAVPAVAISGTKYTVNSVEVGNVSKNVVLGTETGTSATNWCVAVSNPEGDVAASKGYQYSATGGLEEGYCGGTVPTP
ncbi:type II secretion system protein [Demequina rhizosphaerae]|uniref:type II secretion system protein n=1 Tax=Demequina rhizosphaerae TaxID=1638985 RepID=UPI001E587EC4|nr:prepilin-type N-terminal cleavage/methylation domain-containing protein [Demequina rhizosphaerae]